MFEMVFRNDPTPNFSEEPSFAPSDLERQIIKIADSKLGYSNFTKKEWHVLRAQTDNRSIVIKKLTKTD